MNVIRSLLASLHGRVEMMQQRPDSRLTVHGAAPSAQVSAAAAAPPRIPLDLLGPSNTAPGPYMHELADDPLGMVAEYLSPIDQLVMRQVSSAVRTVVDAKVRSLTLTAQEACGLFSQQGDFCHIQNVRLLMCHDADLTRFAQILTSVRNTDFELILHGQDGCVLSALGLRSLNTLTLAGINLQQIQITRDVAEALSQGTSPVSITLPYWRADQADLGLVSGIPMLKSLHANKLNLPNTAVSSLRSHPYLSELSVGELTGTKFRDLTTSASLRSLAVRKIDGDEMKALRGIADNQTLESLRIRKIHIAQPLALISRNRSLTSVALGLSASACYGIPQLAEMPQLDHVTLVRITGRGRLAAGHIEALCAKSLKSLSLHCWEMDLAAWAHVADAHTSRLSLDFCDLNNDAIVSDIAANARITSLSIYGEIINEASALVLASSPSLESLRADFLSDRKRPGITSSFTS